MQMKMPHKFKRYITEPSELIAENRYQNPQNYTLKELKIHVGGMNPGNDNFTLQSDKNTKNKQNYQGMVPLHDRIKNKRHALRRLPQINNTIYHNNCNDQQNKAIINNSSKLQNPLFIVNSLFQIMKEDIVLTNKNSKYKPTSQEGTIEVLSPKITKNQKIKNQFENIESKSVKINRAPRLINNELNRLNNNTKLVNNRRIYSEQKRRPKMENAGIDMLTFYRPKVESYVGERDKTIQNKREVIIDSDIGYQIQNRNEDKQVQQQYQSYQNQFL